MKAGFFGSHRNADPGRLQAAMPADVRSEANGKGDRPKSTGHNAGDLGAGGNAGPICFWVSSGGFDPMAKRLIRYVTYLAYLPLAGAVWLSIVIFGFGFVPFAERACDYAPAGCPPPNPPVWGAGALIFLLCVPLTVIGFVLLRRWLHRLQNLST